MNAELPKAWLGFSGGFAHICAWCPDRHVADAMAVAAAIKQSHGICPECGERLCGIPREQIAALFFDPSTACFSSEHSQAPHAEAAVASTPSASAARVDDFVAAEILAEVCGLSSYDLLTRHRPSHWGAPRDFRMEGSHILFSVAALPDLDDALGEAGLTAAAAKLRAWWMQRTAPSLASTPAAATPWYRKGSYE